jgi:hypothetical protein
MKKHGNPKGIHGWPNGANWCMIEMCLFEWIVIYQSIILCVRWF